MGKHVLVPKNISYMTKMDSYVYNRNYPVTKNFEKKSTAVAFIKRALKIYPYVKIILYKEKGNVMKPVETWKMARNKRGGLSPRSMGYNG